MLRTFPLAEAKPNDCRLRERSTAPNWIPSRIEFRFEAAGAILARPAFRAIVADVSYSDLPVNVDLYWPDWQSWPADVEMAVVNSLPVAAGTRRLARRNGTIRYFDQIQQRGYVSLQGTFDDYMARFTAKQRHNLNRSLRKFSEAAGEEHPWREFRNVEEMERFYDLALQVSAKSWQGRMGSGLPRTSEFRQAVLQRASTGHARGYVLFFKSTPVAYIYCPIESAYVFYDIVGYDPAFQGFSPGTILFLHVLKHLFAEGGWTLLDLGAMAEALKYKASFATASFHCATAYFLRQGLRSEALLLAHYGNSAIRAASKRLLAAIGLRQPVLGMVRRAAGIAGRPSVEAGA